MKKYNFFYIFYLCLVAFNAFAETVSMSLDKKVISEADTVYLTIQYDGQSNVNPDLTSLQNDFNIVSTSTSDQFSFVNGNVNQIHKWKIGLRPLKKGKISISPIRIKDIYSNSLSLEVKEVSDSISTQSGNNNAESSYFKIEQIIDNKSPYIQQQTTMFIRVYDSKGLQNISLSIDEDSQKDWIIMALLKEPSVSQKKIDNKLVNVITYAFAAFPQRSGEIKTPQIHFEGYYVKNSGFHLPDIFNDLNVIGMDFPNVFGQSVPVNMKTKQETLSVKPIPSSYSAKNWLPLSNLELSASWSARNGFKVGEAVTRTIQIKGTGMTKSMLPQISFEPAPYIKQYPDKPEISERMDKNQIITDAQISNVYIPTKSGDLVIPEFSISWFNVETNRMETATLPEESIFVVPNSDIQEAQSIEEKSLENNNVEKQENTPKNNTENIPNFVEQLKTLIKSIPFDIYVKILSGLAFFVFLFLLLKTRKKDQTDCTVILKFLKRHQYREAKEAILHWAAKKYFPAEVKNFNDISMLAKNDDFSEQLSNFNRFLYSDHSDFFDATKFIETLKKIDKMKCQETKKSEVLPNLYD